MIEHCERCQIYAPSWEHEDYTEWHVAISPDGDYIGVVCAGCFAADDLAFVGIEVLRASTTQTMDRPGKLRRRRPRRPSRSASRRSTVRTA